MSSPDGQVDSIDDGVMKWQELHFKGQCLHLTVNACYGFDSAFPASILATGLLRSCLQVLPIAIARSKATGETSLSPWPNLPSHENSTHPARRERHAVLKKEPSHIF